MIALSSGPQISVMIRRFFFNLLLVLFLAAIPALAASPWRMITSSHFYVLTDAGETSGRRVALHLEQMHIIFGQLLSRDKLVTSEPLGVMALGGSAYENAVPFRNGQPSTAGGFFIPGDDRNYIVINAADDDGYRAVAHDYALMLLNYNYPPTQPWFDEGFAQYFSSLRLGAKDGSIGGDPDGTFVSVLSSVQWMPIPELFSAKKSDAKCDSNQQQKLFCAESWMVMHYLINNEKLPEIGSYFGLVMIQKLSVAEAIEKAFGMNAEQFEKAVQDYFHAHMQPSNTASAPQRSLAHPIPLPVEDVALAYNFQDVPEPRAQSLVAEMMIRLPERRDQAMKEINFLMNGDRTESSVQHRALAWLYIQNKDYPRAIEELKDASELKVNDAWVLYYSSLIKYREAQASGKEYRGLENMFQEMRAVIDWNPEFAEAYNMLAMARLDGGGLNSAIEAIRSAVQLAPRNQIYVLHLAEIYMAAKKWDQATPLLEKLKTTEDVAIAHTAAQDLTNLPYLKKYGILPQDAADAEQRAVYSQGSDDDADSNSNSDNSTQPEKAKPDTRPIKYLKGTLVSIDCSKSPEAALKVRSAGKTLTLHIADYKSMVVVGADQPSCEWHDIPVSVNYKDSGSGTGDLVSVEIK
jgi:tetratricopeptide (TPR) repeat protein